MSMFTQFNGPQLVGASTKDIAALIAAYSDVVTKLSELSSDISSHIKETAAKDDAHEVKTYVQNQLATVNTAIMSLGDTINEKLADYATTSSVDGKLVGYETKSALEEALASYATLEQVSNGISTALVNYKTSAEVVQAIEAAVMQVTEGYTSLLKTALGLKLDTSVDFTKWATVNAKYAGTGDQEELDTDGLYILGMLSDTWDDDKVTGQKAFKPAVVFVKYVNDAPLDAVVTVTASYDSENKYNGTLIAQASYKTGTWTGLKFVVIYGTDQSGKEGVYLGISADGIASLLKADFNFYVSGVNFIPAGQDGYISPNGYVAGSAALAHIPDGGGTACTRLGVYDIEYMPAEDAETIWKAYHEEDVNEG